MDEVVDVVTVIIATCSLGHAAANFQQYEQYAFVPNYPGILMDKIPTEKVKTSPMLSLASYHTFETVFDGVNSDTLDCLHTQNDG